MTGLLVIASGAVTLAGGGAYLRHARRETRPQVVSWVIWTVLTAVLAVSSLLTGQVPAAVYLLANGAMGAATLAIVIRRGDWSLGRTGLGVRGRGGYRPGAARRRPVPGCRDDRRRGCRCLRVRPDPGPRLA